MYQQIGTPYNPTELGVANGYPERVSLPMENIAWDAAVAVSDYDPAIFVHEIAQPGADWVALDNSRSAIEARSIEGYRVRFNEEDEPLFPGGRTGIRGRGLFGKSGPNFLAIAVMHTDTEVLAIERVDNGMIALPSGYVDDDECSITEAALRELREEIAPDYIAINPIQVGGLFEIPDPKTTDNAWLVAGILAVRIEDSRDVRLVPQLDEVRRGIWVPFDKILDDSFPAHAHALKQVLAFAGIAIEEV